MLLAGGAGGQTLHTYTQGEFGFPIPEPVDTELPFAGFRSLDGMETRLTGISLVSPEMNLVGRGDSIEGRAVVTYEVTGSASSTTAEGTPRGGVYLQGSIHAREWASPEVAVGVIEWLTIEDEVSPDPWVPYLKDRLRILTTPLTNPDGLAQTHRHAHRVLRYGFEDRDGRNRRKNMRGVDAELETTDDALLGVDLNRNFSNGWRGGSTTSIQYGGTEPFSEPETESVRDSVRTALGQTPLHLVLDFHSFGPYFYVSRQTSEPAYDAAALHVTELMEEAWFAATGLRAGARSDVDIDGQSPGLGPIGATDEYFALEYGALSYTVEVRRPGSGPNGFVLPAADVPDLRTENIAATRAALYFAAGPPALTEIVVWDEESKTTRVHYRRVYQEAAGTRELVVERADSLARGRPYQLILRFNKPLRDTLPGSQSVLPGAQGVAAISASVGGITAEFLEYSSEEDGFNAYAHFPADTAVFRFALPADFSGSDAALAVSGTDAAGLAIDGDPATVARWELGWKDAEPGADAGTPPFSVGAELANDREGWVVR